MVFDLGLTWLLKYVLVDNLESLYVSYTHLSESKVVLAYLLANAPLQMLSLFDDVAMSVTLLNFPDYYRIREVIHVRITDLPTINTLRDLRKSDIGCLVRVKGVVSRRTGVYPQLFLVKFNCEKCGDLLGPFAQNTNVELTVNVCPSCQSKGPFKINMEQECLTLYLSLLRLKSFILSLCLSCLSTDCL